MALPPMAPRFRLLALLVAGFAALVYFSMYRPRSRFPGRTMSVEQGRAIEALHDVARAQDEYRAAHPEEGFATDLAVLEQEGLLTPAVLERAEVGLYTIELRPGPDTVPARPVSHFEAFAYTQTELHVPTFYTDQTSIVWQTETPGVLTEYSLPYGPTHSVVGFTGGGDLLAVRVGVRVQFREIETGRLIRTVTTPNDRAVVHAQSDTTLVSSTMLSSRPQIWRSGRGREPNVVALPDRYRPRAVSADGRRVAAASYYDSLLVVIDVETGRVLMRGEIPRFRTDRGAATFLGPDTVAVSGYDFEWRGDDGRIDLGGALRVWEVSTGREIAAVRSPVGMETMVFDPGGRYVASRARWANAVTLWNVTSGTMTHRLIHSPSGTRVFDLALSPDGSMLATGDQDGLVKVWDVATGVAVTAFRDGGIPHLVFTPDGDELIVSSIAAARIYDPTTGVARATLYDRREEGRDAALRSLAVSRDGRIAAVVEDDVRVWDLRSATEVERHDVPGGVQSAALAFTPSGRLIATWSDSRGAFGWDVETGDELTTMPEIEPPYGLLVSPDGSRAAALSRAAGATTVWDLVTGARLTDLDGTAGAVTFGRDARVLVTRSGGPRIFGVHDLSSGRVLGTVDDPRAGSSARPPVAIDPTGSVMAVAEESSADSTALYDIRTGELLMTAPPERVIAVAPDGRLFAGGDRGGVILDPAGRREVVLVREVTNPINGQLRETDLTRFHTAAFSPDGRLLATTGDDGDVRIWDTRTGREVLAFTVVDLPY